MLVKKIEYLDYNGNKRKEEFRFNMTAAELVKWGTTSGDYTMEDVVNQLTKERDGKRIMEMMDEVIRASYGEKSLDGKRFMKGEDITKSFVESEAYSVLFMELVTDAKKASEFINGILPKEIVDEANRMMAEKSEIVPESTASVV